MRNYKGDKKRVINQAAKRILKALSFDGVEVDAFRHMADLKRLDPMKILQEDRRKNI